MRNPSLAVFAGALLSSSLVLAQNGPAKPSAPPRAASKAAAPAVTRAQLPPAALVSPQLSRLARALSVLDQARSAAEYMKAIAGVRDAAISRIDPLTGLERPGERTLPAAPHAGAPPMPQPSGAPDGRITERLRQPKPRGTMVSPGGIPDNSLGLVSTNNQNDQRTVTTVERTTSDGQGGTTHTSVTHENGRVTEVETDHYDSEGNLTGFERTEYDADGTQRHLDGDVTRRGAHTGGGATVTIDAWTTRGGQVDVQAGDAQRPHSPQLGDPPLQRGRLDRYQPVEGTGGKDNAAWCNPISGHCYKAGIRTSSRYVNPARGEPVPMTGPLIVPQGLAVNPSPIGTTGTQLPQPIPRTGATPGARPPDPE